MYFLPLFGVQLCMIVVGETCLFSSCYFKIVLIDLPNANKLVKFKKIYTIKHRMHNQKFNANIKNASRQNCYVLIIYRLVQTHH